MGKKYLMFIDENGFTDKKNNFYMVGVIFEEEYYLKSSIDNVLNDLDLNPEINSDKIHLLKSELNNALKDSKFNVIMSKVKYEDDIDENAIINAFKKLLYKYYCFIIENGGDNAGIAVKHKKEFYNTGKGQIMFNLYMEREKMKGLNNCNKLINRFMIVDNASKEYDSLSEIYSIIKKSIIYSCNNQENGTRRYRYSDIINENIIKTIKNKIFIEEIAFDI